jgi:hypothetical protein
MGVLSELKQEFDFILSDKLIEASSGIGDGEVFHAKLIHGFYAILFDDGSDTVTYTVDEVVECLEDGDWIIV